MTDDEIVKTCYLALEIAVRHELLEGFIVDGAPLFNPHVKYERLLSASSDEVHRSQQPAVPPPKTPTHRVRAVDPKSKL